MKVKDIFEAQHIIESWLEESFGEITPEIEELMDELDEHLEDIVGWAIVRMKEHQAISAGKKEYAEEIMAKSKSEYNKANGLKNLIDNLMRSSGKDKLDILEGTVSYRKSTILVIDDEDLVPEEYLKTEVKVDKAKLKKEISGECEYAHIEEKQNIQIRG